MYKTDKNNLSVPKTDVNFKLLEPSLCMVRVRGLEPPEHGFLDRSLCQFEYTRVFGERGEIRTLGPSIKSRMRYRYATRSYKFYIFLNFL